MIHVACLMRSTHNHKATRAMTHINALSMHESKFIWDGIYRLVLHVPCSVRPTYNHDDTRAMTPAQWRMRNGFFSGNGFFF